MSKFSYTAAALSLAAVLLAGSTLPSAAASERSTAHTAHSLGYTAAPPHAQPYDADAYRADVLDEDRMMDDATAYCLNRFKSYDPESGTYLGYDGVERACP